MSRAWPGQAVFDFMKNGLKGAALLKKIRFNFIEESASQTSDLKFLKLLSGGLCAVVRIEGKILTTELVRIEQVFFTRELFNGQALAT
ncbi:hypothetical protein [Piscirickettsia litoralis]|uniref:Uncharacterized protein n=1 Tax=Piscirickettsia litoralis TaxID=1891921 RepID=A0ABX3A0Y9_9GAMM|nr:hypothetical protein [Piscirickettsia litoralis]ODN42541.1 hypothetical protein BGC07_05865 [Piscirickettsia litoralis]